MSKGPDAFRTISEVAEALDLPQHVLRFWETRFSQIRPLKRGGGRRYYRPEDVDLLRGIRHLLYGEGFTIKGVQRILKEQGPRFVIGAGRGEHDGNAALAARGAPRRPLDRDELARSDEGEALEAGEIADAAEELEDAPRLDMEAPPVRRPAERGQEAAPSAPPKLTGEEVRVLEGTLSDLLECRRLLDELR